MVSLNITYTGSSSKTQGTENTGFFSQPLVLYQMNDKWSVSIGYDGANEHKKFLF